MFAGKPVIGVIGGVGSGKSHVARMFGQLGCLVIDSDELIASAYQREDVKNTLRAWWGPDVLDRQGQVIRSTVARKVFNHPAERQRLETLLHPVEAEMRQQIMRDRAGDEQVRAYVWDTPLLVEAGLAGRCDAVVFVDAPDEVRFERVQRARGWSRAEWESREKSQLPLDKKRKIANDIVWNTSDADDEVRDQVREVLSRILAEVRR